MKKSYKILSNILLSIGACLIVCGAILYGVNEHEGNRAYAMSVDEIVKVKDEISRIKAWVEKVRDRFPGLEAELSPEVALNEYTDKASMPGREEPGGTDRGDGAASQQDKDDGADA